MTRVQIWFHFSTDRSSLSFRERYIDCLFNWLDWYCWQHRLRSRTCVLRSHFLVSVTTKTGIETLNIGLLMAYSNNRHCITLSTLGKIFSSRHVNFFFYFFQNTGFWHFMQIFSTGENLHEMSICSKCQTCFLGKIRQTYEFVVSWIWPENGKG